METHSPAPSSNRIRPDVPRISKMLGFGETMIKQILQIKTPIQRGIENANSYLELCEFTSSRILSDDDKAQIRSRTRVFAKELYQLQMDLESLETVKLEAVTSSGTRFSDQGFSSSLDERAPRALEIIADPVLRPKTIAEVQKARKTWQFVKEVRSSLDQLKDEYILQILNDSSELSFEELLKLGEEAVTNASHAYVVQRIIPFLIDRSIAQWAYSSLRQPPRILNIFTDLLKKDLAEATASSVKGLILGSLSPQVPTELRWLVHEDFFLSLLSEGRIDVALRHIEQSARDDSSLHERLRSHYRNWYDKEHLKDVGADKSIEDLCTIREDAPYQSKTFRSARVAIGVKLDGMILETSGFGEINSLIAKYGHELSSEHMKTLRDKRLPYINKLIMEARGLDEYLAIWQLLDDQERRDRIREFVILLAPVCQISEDDGMIELPSV